MGGERGGSDTGDLSRWANFCEKFALSNCLFQGDGQGHGFLLLVAVLIGCVSIFRIVPIDHAQRKGELPENFQSIESCFTSIR